MKSNSILQALGALKKGKMIILVDDESRENEGDFVLSAEKITPAHLNFMVQEGRGLICLSVEQSLLKKLNIPMMTSHNTSTMQTAFTVSIEAAKGVTTGSSTFDRAHTILTAIHPNATPKDLVMPGHLFPLACAKGGVFARAGHTEGSVDLMRLARLHPSAVICEIMRKDGKMARLPDLKKLSQKFKIPIISIEDILQYRIQHDPVIEEAASAKLPVLKTHFNIKAFRQPFEETCHLALINNKIKDKRKPHLVRIHSECLTGDALGSLRCDCGEQLQLSLDKISQEGGLLLYLRQEGRGIGLLNKIKAYSIQDSHQLDTVEANQQLGFAPDDRKYSIPAQILHKLGISTIRLLTNNPHKIRELEQYGIKIVERIPLLSPVNPHNQHYLKTKREKLGHMFDV